MLQTQQVGCCLPRHGLRISFKLLFVGDPPFVMHIPHAPPAVLFGRLEMIWLRVMIRWGFGMRIQIGKDGQDHR